MVFVFAVCEKIDSFTIWNPAHNHARQVSTDEVDKIAAETQTIIIGIDRDTCYALIAAVVGFLERRKDPPHARNPPCWNISKRLQKRLVPFSGFGSVPAKSAMLQHR
jgi:hypothetical protein